MNDKFPMKECPNCGNDEIYIKSKIIGECLYNIKLDGSHDAYNGEMYDYTHLKPMSKYAYCNECGKRLFKHNFLTL